MEYRSRVVCEGWLHQRIQVFFLTGLCVFLWEQLRRLAMMCWELTSTSHMWTESTVRYPRARINSRQGTRISFLPEPKNPRVHWLTFVLLSTLGASFGEASAHLCPPTSVESSSIPSCLCIYLPVHHQALLLFLVRYHFTSCVVLVTSTLSL